MVETGAIVSTANPARTPPTVTSAAERNACNNQVCLSPPERRTSISNFPLALGSPGYIQPCSWQNQTGCCETDGAQSCCGNSSALFSWKPSYIKTVIDSNGQNRLAYALPGTISGTITATAVPVQTTPGALYHDAYATVTVSGASTGTATNAALRTGAQQQSDTNVGVIVVSGVLGPVCCVLIVAIVWALRRYNRERHTRQDVEKRYQTLRTLSTEKMTRSTMRSSPCPPELVQRCSTVPELDPDAGILEAHE